MANVHVFQDIDGIEGWTEADGVFVCDLDGQRSIGTYGLIGVRTCLKIKIVRSWCQTATSPSCCPYKQTQIYILMDSLVV